MLYCLTNKNTYALHLLLNKYYRLTNKSRPYFYLIIFITYKINKIMNVDFSLTIILIACKIKLFNI